MQLFECLNSSLITWLSRAAALLAEMSLRQQLQALQEQLVRSQQQRESEMMAKLRNEILGYEQEATAELEVRRYPAKSAVMA